MKRYHVIKKQSANNEYLNDQDLLPASCKRITGVAVSTTVKKEGEAVDSTIALAFPQGLIRKLLATDGITNLFYSYMQTRTSAEESKAFFETDILPEIATVLTEGIQYPCLTDQQQSDFSLALSELLMGGSNQEEIDWEQRLADLKMNYKAQLIDFLIEEYDRYRFEPEAQLSDSILNMLYDPTKRNNAINSITPAIYYTVHYNGYLGNYSSVSKNISTFCNPLMLDYDHQYAQLQEEKEAYEKAETKGLSHYLFATVGIFEKGQTMGGLAYTELILNETLSFIYQNKSGLFIRPVKKHLRPEAYECGTISLLVNGNSFLLRDYVLTANRKIKHLSKEIIPFSEPLEVNSSIQTVYKSNRKNGAEPLNIRIYIQYEDFKEPLADVESNIQEAMV